MATPTTCSHIAELPSSVTASGQGCKECLELGDSWVQLRECLTCGHVGCCDSSTNTHATKHYEATHHPIIRSIEPGQDWRWCYVDQLMLA